jgi:hypothetical protein
MRFTKWWGLCALVLQLAAPAAWAQPATSSSARLAALESAVATLTQSLLTLQSSNAALTQDLQTKSALIASLQAGLLQEITDRTSYADSVGANALANAKTYSDGRLAPVSDKLVYFSRSGTNVYISGANLHIRNGLGATSGFGVNGLGNLIVGYNESRGQVASPDVRTGSHNIIMGQGINFSGAASIMTGINNTSSNNFASVLGGTGNTASGTYSVVVGGYNNVTSGGWAAILGGRDNVMSGQLAHFP